MTRVLCCDDDGCLQLVAVDQEVREAPLFNSPFVIWMDACLPSPIPPVLSPSRPLPSPVSDSSFLFPAPLMPLDFDPPAGPVELHVLQTRSHPPPPGAACPHRVPPRNRFTWRRDDRAPAAVRAAMRRPADGGEQGSPPLPRRRSSNVPLPVGNGGGNIAGHGAGVVARG